ncbi:MAG TPA: Rv3235 family protein [Candidatus Eisenbacteria bacterium]|nr:Rv3235 family protein [Candidatus Eisenbacteria bacterium]
MATTSPLRRLPVPDREPPFDDEAPRSSADRLPGLATDAVQGTLALAFVLPTGVPATPAPPPDLRLVAAEASGDPDEADFGPQPTARADLPEPRQWAGRFVQAVVEVLAGDRPAGQLVRWTSSSVYDDVSSRVVAAARRETPARGVVRSVHVTEPADGVAEVAALVRRGMRSTAIALRLEGMDGRWQCTALELG